MTSGRELTRPLRDRASRQRVSDMELFVDLVAVLTVTQLSRFLEQDPTVHGVLESTLLLTIFWLLWVDTAWLTNFVDPGYTEIRLLLIVGMLVNLAMSAAVPRAFGSLGLVIGGGYATLKIGRNLVTVIVLRGPVRKNFELLLAWHSVVGVFALAGGLVHGPPRVVLWVLAVGIDLTAGFVGFATPGLGRLNTHDWTIDGGHFARRCQSIALITIGEVIIVTGQTLSGIRGITGSNVAGFVIAFAGSVALWWLYFAYSADAGMNVITLAPAPERFARSAYQLIHPAMAAGIIAWAAGDEKVITSPLSRVSAPSAWLILGGPALFLAGHAAFQFALSLAIPRERIIGVAVLVLLSLATAVLSEVALAACAVVVIVAVAASDHYWHHSHGLPAGM